MNACPLGVLPAEAVMAAADDALGLEVRGYTSAYEEYSVGSWASAPLWSDPSGQASGEVREHETAAEPIPSIRGCHGINSLISNYFDTASLRCARLFRASHGAIVLPHRDYLEHSYGFVRLHVPLISDPASARNTEDRSCFHMRVGEVWYLDARRTHSGGVLGPGLRVHLVLDFRHDLEPRDAVTAPESAPSPMLIERPPIPNSLLPNYMALAPFIDAAAWRDIVAILARVHLRYEANADAVYDWLEEIAANTTIDKALLMRDAARMKRYYLSVGPSTVPPFPELWDAEPS